MGLREDIQTDVGEAFDTDLADAVKVLTLLKVSGVYDQATGNNDITETPFATRGVPDRFSINETSNEAIYPTDVKMIILQNEVGAVPEVDDFIQEGSNKYKVIDIKADPADAHWEIQCRL